ncbi:MAG: PAS domain S-box protein [Ignavibacteriaceae bacterium]|nr:PAS domain S-box protein [Ignavibacteriaceae bacterium]
MEKLRVLMAEDSEDDLLLVLRELKKGGFEPDYKWVTDAEGFKRALEEDAYEIVLSDYSMKGFNALNALELLKACGAEIPFIVVSGSIGDQTAVQLMKQGAADYIMKDNLNRLAEAIRREVRENKIRLERKTAGAQLRESEERLRLAMEASLEGIWDWDIQNNKKYFSPAYNKIRRETEASDDSYGFLIQDILPEDKDPVIDKINAMLEGETDISDCEFRVDDGHGGYRWIQAKTKVVSRDSEGRPLRIVGTNVDITKDKNTQEELKEAAELYEKLLSTLNEGIKIIDLEGNVKWANDNTLNLYGLENLSEIVGHSCDEFIDKTSKAAAKEHFRKCAENGHSEGVELTVFRKDKKWIECESSASLVKDKNDQPAYIVAVMKDVTEIKKNEEMVKRLSLAIEQTADTIFITNRNGVIEYVNSALLNIYGYDRDEVVGHNPRIFKSGIKDRDFYKTMWDTIISGETFRAEVINKRKDGTYAFEDRNITPVKDEEGNISHFLSVGRDITERKLAEITQKKSERRFSNILKTAQDGFLIVNQEGYITEVNDAYCSMTGYTRSELLKMHITRLDVNEDLESSGERIKQLTLNGSGRWEAVHRRKDGSLFYVEVSVTMSQTDDNSMISFLKDITDRKKLIEELVSARDKAEEMNSLKSNFLANMSHELRTPLIGVIGYAEIMTDMVKDSDVLDMAQTIFNSGHRLLRTLNLILDLSRIESNRQEIDYQEMNVSEAVSESVRIYENIIRAKNLQININLPDQPLVWELDPGMFDTILSNILDNAVKFTNEGGISVSVTVMVSGGERNLSVEVKDTGIGIDENSLALIFEEFRQASEGMSRIHEGTGLGLTITKKYVDLLRGRIEVESTPGEGSSFRLVFPEAGVKDGEGNQTAETSEGGSESAPAKVQTGAPDILIVDDDPLAIDVARTFLRKIEKISDCADYYSAVEIASANNFNLLIIDINLGGGKNGVEVLTELRKMEQYRDAVAIACTAYASLGDEEHLIAAGFDDYISKPFSAKVLRNKIDKFFPGYGI